MRNIFAIWVVMLLANLALLAGAVWLICVIVKHFFPGV